MTSRGLFSPSRRMFSMAPAGSYRLVPPLDTVVHVSSHPLPPTRPPASTRRRSSSGSARHRKTSPAAQRAGGHRRVVTKKVTGGYPATKGTDPETELRGTTGSRYGHLVCTGRGRRWFTHGVGTAYTPCSLGSPRARHGASSVANRLSDDAKPQSQRGKVASFPEAPRVSPEGRETL